MNKTNIYEQLKKQMCSSLRWNGKNGTQGCQLRKRCFSFKEDTIIYETKMIVIGDEQIINIQVNTPTAFEKLYLYLCDIRRFQYLIDGAFYRMNKCDADAVDVTDIVAGIELGYFFSGSYKHKIPLNLTDDEYKYYLSKWCKLQSSLGMIYPMALFANCVNGLPADVRIAMLSECFEALGKSLEDEKKLAVKPEKKKIRKAKCPKCNEQFETPIKGKKTFACYMRAIVESCGKITFSSEYSRREDLIREIVKTRNKVFHVDDKNKGLNGEQCGFYAVKLEWMLRYIIWLEMEFPKDTLDVAIEKEIKAFEKRFPRRIKILFVCHGNICRSPMAEFVMKDMVQAAGLQDKIYVESAATSTEEIGNPVYPPARRKLAEHGISCAGKTARQLRRRDYEEFDLLIGMDDANLRNMRRMCGGDEEGKIHAMMDYTNRPGEVADPWYTGNFEDTWQDVNEGCRGLLEQLKQEML